MCTWPGFKPAPYVAKYKWVWTEEISKMKKESWKKYIQQSYDLVKNKLSVNLGLDWNNSIGQKRTGMNRNSSLSAKLLLLLSAFRPQSMTSNVHQLPFCMLQNKMVNTVVF